MSLLVTIVRILFNDDLFKVIKGYSTKTESESEREGAAFHLYIK